MKYVRWFSEISLGDIAQVGGKNASLGELSRLLSDDYCQLPDGFAVTADGYRELLRHNRLKKSISSLLEGLDTSDTRRLQETGLRIRRLLQQAELPPPLEQELTDAWQQLRDEKGPKLTVAVRSSATAEDLPDASFAGQQETCLNVGSLEQLLESMHRVYASLFTDRAISYRVDKGYGQLDVALSVGVQQMVRADLACSGVMFTLDTESGFRDLVLITSAWGLGENIVRGTVNPDEFLVFKPTLLQGKRPIVKRQLGEKAIKMVRQGASDSQETTQNVKVEASEREHFSLSDDEVLKLAATACRIEQHYSALHGHPQPMDIEWAKDGLSGGFYILQARPETVHSQQPQLVTEIFRLQQRGPLLAEGRSVGTRIAAGNGRIIADVSEMHLLQPGEVLVTDVTDPDWEPVMKIAAAIVTNRGGRVCHAAIIARELGIPAVVGTGDGVDQIRDGQPITVSCAEGDCGKVYAGMLDFEVRQQQQTDQRRPITRMMMNVADPQRAFEFSRLPNDGVGLARLEFIVSHQIGIHPRAALELQHLPDSLRQDISRRCRGYRNPVHYYVSKMTEGIGAIAAAFWPKPVILRFSDFKSNEYGALLGGADYEPEEANPMLGFRGAGRYPSPEFAECFALECRAVKQVREGMGLTNLMLMIPFVRTPEDLDQVLSLMEKQGLRRGDDGLCVYTMCEIPANVVLADQFLSRCDGYSIGSNDLTQLTLGVDRDSGLLTRYDERNEAVMRMMATAIEACNKQGKYVGICGQAPSDFPEITRWLVEQGIGSISLTPDSLLAMTQLVLELEEERAGEG